MSHVMSCGSSFSALQKNLQLAYSSNTDDQELAADNLAKLVANTSFPVVSFGPLAHALCRLLPSPSREVATNAARATKLLILDEALRPQVNVVGVPTVVVAAIKQWEDEMLCLRELLGALQTLCYDKSCVRGVLSTDGGSVVKHLTDYIQASDQEVAVLALSCVVNLLAFADTLLLQEEEVIESFKPAMPILLEISNLRRECPQRFYATAAVANAAAHPSLAEVLLLTGGLAIMQELEEAATANIHLLGSKMGECAQTALYLLSRGDKGSPTTATHDFGVDSSKYSFRWGTQPTMDLVLVDVTSAALLEKHGKLLAVCALVWTVMVVYTFSPLVFGSE